MMGKEQPLKVLSCKPMRPEGNNDNEGCHTLVYFDEGKVILDKLGDVGNELLLGNTPIFSLSDG